MWETVKVIIQALLIAFVVRTFFYQPFNIPSASMYPTLKVGDYLFVSKLSYGYGKYSFNFSLGMFGNEIITCCPIDFPGRVVLAETPKRGDVAVFKLPTDTEIDYIKRVIGLPGDRIQMRDGVLYINGEAVKKERIEDYTDPSEPGLRHGRCRSIAKRCPTASATACSTPSPGRGRQHGGICGARGPLFHDGRQPRQLAGFALPAGGLCADREFRRPRRHHLLLGLA